MDRRYERRGHDDLKLLEEALFVSELVLPFHLGVLNLWLRF